MPDQGLGTTFYGGLTPEDWMLSGTAPPPSPYDQSPLGPSWLQRAQDQTQKDIANYQQGGIPQMLADTTETQDLASGFGGGGIAGTTRDPALWHGISGVKLQRPLSEMEATHVPFSNPGAVPEKTITPSALQGGLIVPFLGDRSIAGTKLLSVGGTKLPEPTVTKGGHGFMAENAGENAAWGNTASPAATLSGIVHDAAKTGKPVYGSYTAQGPTSIDFNTMTSDTLANMLANAAIGSKDVGAFNRAMKNPTADFPAIKDWPGVDAENLAEYLRGLPGKARTKFAQTMDTRNFQDRGFPNVGEARFALTDPRLLDVPTSSGGLSIARLDPTGTTFSHGIDHPAFPVKLGGQYEGGLGAQVPRDIMYADIINAFKKMGYGPEGTDPVKRKVTFDYLLKTGAGDAPRFQRANQQWVDRTSKWLEKNQQ